MTEWAVDPFRYDFCEAGDDLVATHLTFNLDGESVSMTSEDYLKSGTTRYLIEGFLPTVRGNRNHLVWLVVLQRDPSERRIGIELADLTAALSDGEMEVVGSNGE